MFILGFKFFEKVLTFNVDCRYREMQDGIVLLLGSFLPFDFCLWFYVSVALNVKINVYCFHFREIYMFKISKKMGRHKQYKIRSSINRDK